MRRQEGRGLGEFAVPRLAPDLAALKLTLRLDGLEGMNELCLTTEIGAFCTH